MDEIQIDPPQRGEGDDPEREVAVAAVPALSEEEAREKILKAREKIEALHGRISKLLQHEGRRVVSAAHGLILSRFEFIVVELNGIIASLNEMPLSELVRNDVRKNLLDWLGMVGNLPASNSAIVLYGYEQVVARPVSRFSRLLHRHRDTSKSLTKLFGAQSDLLEHVESVLLVVANFSPCLYEHALVLADGIYSSYTAEVDAGGNHTSLVGVQGAVRKMLRWYREDDGGPNIISIAGPAGAGKTALAMEVYRQLQIERGEGYFDYCATARVSCIPQVPEIWKLLLHILSQIDERAAQSLEASGTQLTRSNDELDELGSEIKQRLEDKRYLILLDDLWAKHVWDIINYICPPSPGSQIIITTRLPLMAYSICSNVHIVQPLNELDSERLLFRKAGMEDGCLPDNLKQSCHEILRRCEGIPSFLCGNADWLSEQLLQQQEVQKIPSISSLEKIPQLLKQFGQSFSPSYDILHHGSKLLLSYMSMFPHGHIFDMDSLISKCVAQGLVDYSGDDRVEVAKGYFTELIDVGNVIKLAGCKQWQINYFMSEFLASKAADKGFACTSGTIASVAQAAGEGKKVRWLYLHQPDAELPTQLGKFDLSHTRSLLLSGTVSQIPFDKFIYLVVLDLDGWQCFKDEDLQLICSIMFLLRYLSLRNTDVSMLPAEIKKLSRLETLDVSHTRISELPSDMCELNSLETLDVSHTSISQLPAQIWDLSWSPLHRLDLRSTLIRKLPKEMWRLIRLKHLLIGGDGLNQDGTEIPLGSLWRDMKWLCTLETIDLTGFPAGVVKRLARLESLEVLSIIWALNQCTETSYQQALCKSIKAWQKLKSLTIHCGLGCSVEFLEPLSGEDWSKVLEIFKVTGGTFNRIPKWIAGLNKLTSIEITVCRVMPDDLSILGNLPSLVFLVLGLNFVPEETILIHGVGFPCLVNLSVSCRVPWLTFEQGAMPRLTYLELKIADSPASQESVPSGITNLLSLSEVAIRYNVRYANSPTVKMTEAAVRKQVAGHCDLSINGMQDQQEEAAQEAGGGVAVIDGVQDQAEDAQEAEEGATASTSEIEVVDTARLHDQSTSPSAHSHWYP